MKKKIIALILIFAMLVPLSPAVAADEPSSQPTIEEILNGYHQKAFEAQSTQDAETASTWSRGSGSNKTLEQETVEELTAAGYEAYNVTGENYTSLETTLKTDFSEMGLDPEGSYIVVISGEKDNTATSNSSRGSDITLPPHVENEGGSGHGGSVSTFTYTWGDYTLTMRYLTITAADNPRYRQADSCSLLDESSVTDLIESVLNTAISFVLDASGFPVGTILSILGIELFDINQISDATLDFHAGANWTREYTQVYYESTDMWLSHASVDYVQLTTLVTGLYYDTAQNCYMTISNSETSVYAYSQYYHNYSWRNQMAARGWYHGVQYNDYSGDVYVYFDNDDQQSQTSPEVKFVFYQYKY